MQLPPAVIARASFEKNILLADQGDHFVVQFDVQMDRNPQSFEFAVLYIEPAENKADDLVDFTGEVRVGDYKYSVSGQWSRHFEMLERIQFSEPVPIAVGAVEGATPPLPEPLVLTHDFSVAYLPPRPLDRLGDLVGRIVAGLRLDGLQRVLGGLLRPRGKSLLDAVNGDVFLIDFADDDARQQQLFVQIVNIERLPEADYDWDYQGRLLLGQYEYQFLVRAPDDEPEVIQINAVPGMLAPPVPLIRHINAVMFTERPPV